MNCTSVLHTFDPRVHKPKYRGALHAVRGFDAAMNDYNMTFAAYLTETAGKRFDPPIEFEMAPATMEQIYHGVEEETVDFFYSDPGLYSCVGVEHGAQPLATVISRLEARGHSYDLDVYGGVIFAKVDNDDISTILDLQNNGPRNNLYPYLCLV